jgi:hypothetical protein
MNVVPKQETTVNGKFVNSTFDPDLMKEESSLEFVAQHSVLRLIYPDGEVRYYAVGRVHPKEDNLLDQDNLMYAYFFYTTPNIENAFIFTETFCLTSLDDETHPARWAARRAAQWIRAKTYKVEKVEIVCVDVTMDVKSVTETHVAEENNEIPAVMNPLY